MKTLKEQLDELRKWVKQVWSNTKERNEKVDILLDGLAKNSADASKTMEDLQKLITNLTEFTHQLAKDYTTLKKRVDSLEEKGNFIKKILDWVFKRE